MSYDGRLMRQALARFDEDKQRRAENFRARERAVYTKCPRIEEIDRELSHTMAKIIASGLRRGADPRPAIAALQESSGKLSRNMIDDAVNIRGLKRYAVDHAGYVPHPACAEETGKTVAIVGGGPSGLSAAYYLALMGHKVTVYDVMPNMGGMLRYGIPNYRFPRERLQEDIDTILSTGVEVKLNTRVGNGEGEISYNKLHEEYDAVYIAIGAHTDKKIGIEGEDANGVMSAVEMLRRIPPSLLFSSNTTAWCPISSR